MSTTVAASKDQVLPPPVVRFSDHPLRWIFLKFELLVAALTLAHIGMFIVVAIYYLLTQKNPRTSGHPAGTRRPWATPPL